MSIFASILVLVAAPVGVALSILTLPGVWFILLVALLCQWMAGEPPMFSWWTIGACAGLGLLSEILEFAASAAGSARAGGGRAASLGSIAGAIIGAVAGSLVLPVIGTIAGGVVGAGLGAVAGERGIARKEWSHSFRVGQGAMVGRFIATIVKTILCALVGIILAVAAFIP